MAVLTPSNAAAPLPLDAGVPDVPWERVEGFIGQLAHDIRNGLNALELQLTFLGEISTDPEAVDEIKRVRATVGNITRQLQTLRVATGAVHPYALEYPAADFFDDLRERLVKLHPESSERFVWDTRLDAGFMLSVDPELTLNALLELLSNALSFADDTTSRFRATVTATADKATVTLQEPRASQPGVTLQDWGRAPLLTTRRGAYGLGLFRVRRAIEAQGGELEVDYSPENQMLTTKVALRGVPQT